MMRKQEETVMKEDELDEGGQIARQLARRWLDEAAELIPLALIALEIEEPVELVADRLGDAVQLNDVGMRAVPAEVAREFLTERAEQAARMEEQSRRLQEAHKPSPVGGGVPALEDASPFASLMNSDPSYVTPSQEFGQRPKPDFLAEELEAGQRQQAAARAEAEAKVAARGKNG